MEGENCFINADVEEVVGDNYHVQEVEEMEGEGAVGGVGTQVLRKLVDIVSVQEGSVGGSSCGSQRSKLRLCLEMNIKNKLIGGVEISDEEDKHANADPVMVVVDYPDDVIVTVNAKIQRLERDVSISSYDEVDHERVRKGWKTYDQKGAASDQDDNKILDSTFVKVPLSSTFIHPIVEEPEISSVAQENGQNVAIIETENETGGKVARKSNSGDASLYQTVMEDNDGAVKFGNISSIAKTDVDNNDKATDDSSSNNVSFGKHPSIKLNSNKMLFKSEKTTPAEKLVKALHILARYRGVWGIYEDETRIVKHLINLNRILTTTDSATVHNTCREEDYLEVRGLVSYFSLEKRFVIRSELMQTFTLLSQKSPAVSAFIARSEIPVVLASEVEAGDYTTREMYAYSSYFLQMMSVMQLTEAQCDEIGEAFYGRLCEMIINAEKKHYGPTSEVLLEILLNYHMQLRETDFKWQSLHSAAKNKIVMRKIKQKLTNIFLRNASLSPRFDEGCQIQGSEEKIKEILLILNDFIVCNATKDLFANAELDIILVTLIHNLENSQLVEFRREALKTIHRILLVIKMEPSGLDKLERLVLTLIREVQESGSGDYDRCYWGVLKKIYKIISVSSNL